MSLTQIDLQGFERDLEAQQKADWSGMTVVCLLAIFLGLGLMYWSLTTGHGFGPAFWCGLSLTIATAVFGSIFAENATRYCSQCGRPTPQHLANFDSANVSGLLGMVAGRRVEVNGRSYLRNTETPVSNHDYQLGWQRMMCGVAACKHCCTYTITAPISFQPLTDEDRFALLEHETGYIVT